MNVYFVMYSPSFKVNQFRTSSESSTILSLFLAGHGSLMVNIIDLLSSGKVIMIRFKAEKMGENRKSMWSLQFEITD